LINDIDGAAGSGDSGSTSINNKKQQITTGFSYEIPPQKQVV
jgi:hypothetical protein